LTSSQVARVLRTPLPGRLAPERAPLLVAGEPGAFVLCGAWAGGGAIAGARPVRVAGEDADPFALLDETVDVEDAHPDAFGGGWVGYLGYDLGRRLERLPPPPPRPAPLPAFALAFYDHVARCDARGRWWFEALWTPARAAPLREALARFGARLAAPAAPRTARVGPLAPGPSGTAAHLAAVEACRERIAAGDLFQANLCLRLQGEWDGDPAALAVAAWERLRPDCGAFLRGPWGAVVSASPELFLRRRGREVVTRPIKGTTAGDPDALTASEKDRAENVMIVDLMRNDLGRVCEPGSVEVRALAALRRTTGVWSLESEVAGTLAAGAGDADLLRATFPPGSVTGAPKIQAQKVIAELETTARECYTGAIGFVSPVAGLELSVAIRTLELDARGHAWVGAGGGITYGSQAERELDECYVKAEPLAAALGTRVVRPAPGPGAPQVVHAGVPRADPAGGLLETMRLQDGRVVRLEEHLARLRASARDVYGREPPPGARAAVEGALAPGVWRLRLTALGDQVEVERLAAPPGDDPLRLVPAVLPGGWGAHKWADRRGLDTLAARLGAMPLLVDADGCVLEAAIGNVWLVEDGAVVTPPTDGRILPGVTRAALLRRAPALGLAAHAEPVSLDRLEAADAVFVTTALRLAAPATLGGGAPPGERELVARIAAALAQGD
jgi:para-aminobenzoate synthetase/4-amino-4-deoxychorismate lyase